MILERGAASLVPRPIPIFEKWDWPGDGLRCNCVITLRTVIVIVITTWRILSPSCHPTKNVGCESQVEYFVSKGLAGDTTLPPLYFLFNSNLAVPHYLGLPPLPWPCLLWPHCPLPASTPNNRMLQEGYVYSMLLISIVYYAACMELGKISS